MTKKDIAEITVNESKERIEAAELLMKAGKFEDSVSRTYYALFDAIRGLLELKEIFAKSHLGAIIKFNQLYIKTGIFDKRFAKVIARIKNLREDADYTFKKDISKIAAQEALTEAKKFVSVIEKYLKDNYLTKNTNTK